MGIRNLHGGWCCACQDKGQGQKDSFNTGVLLYSKSSAIKPDWKADIGSTMTFAWTDERTENCIPIWATPWQNQQNGVCAQGTLTSAQSDQSSLCAQWVAKDPGFLHADSEDWSDWVDAQADLSLCWVHMPFCWLWHEVAHILNYAEAGTTTMYINENNKKEHVIMKKRNIYDYKWMTTRKFTTVERN